MTNPAPATRFELELGADARRPADRPEVPARLRRGRVQSNGPSNGSAAVLVAGPYRWDAYDIRAYGVETNRVGTGSYRGPAARRRRSRSSRSSTSSPRRSGIDPIDLRSATRSPPGDRMVDGEAWVRIGAREVLEAIADHPLWQGRADLPDGEGIGLAVGVWPGGREPAAAVCRLEPDGSITVITGVVDMSGVASGFATIAAEAFGVSPDKVQVVAHRHRRRAALADVAAAASSRTPWVAPSSSAAEATQEKLLRYASEELEIEPGDLEIVDGRSQPQGRARPRQADRRARREARRLRRRVRADRGPRRRAAAQPGAARFGPPRARPRRSRDRRGQAPQLRHRPGRRARAQPGARSRARCAAAPPRASAGRCSRRAVRRPGAAAVGLAHGLRAAASPATCRRSRRSSSRCPRPTARSAPRAIGEAPVCGSPAAIANAVANALGQRVYRLPMTAPRVWAAANNEVFS